MPSSVDIHKAAHAAFNGRDWDRMAEITAEDVRFVDHARGLSMAGRDEFFAWLHEWTGGMSDAKVDDVEYLDAGTHSICRFNGTGTNDGPMGPVNATGRAVAIEFCEIVEVTGGQIAGGHMYYDMMAMLAQLGVIEAPAPA